MIKIIFNKWLYSIACLIYWIYFFDLLHNPPPTAAFSRSSPQTEQIKKNSIEKSNKKKSYFYFGWLLYDLIRDFTISLADQTPLEVPTLWTNQHRCLCQSGLKRFIVDFKQTNKTPPIPGRNNKHCKSSLKAKQ